jgi:hypothetical protein
MVYVQSNNKMIQIILYVMTCLMFTLSACHNTLLKPEPDNYLYNKTAKYRIGILDTGYDPESATVELKLCETGHYDFLLEQPGISHNHVHGTYIANIIAEKLKDIDYCAVIYQVQDYLDGYIYSNKTEDALKRAKSEHLTALNISISGEYRSLGEESALRSITEVTPVFIAAGNKGLNLDEYCNVFPACYDVKNAIVVGALNYEDPSQHAEISNYGKRVDIWAPAYYKDGDKISIFTSYAAPRALADYVLYLDNRDKGNLK